MIAASWKIICAFFSATAHWTNGNSDCTGLCIIQKTNLKLKDYSYLDH